MFWQKRGGVGRGHRGRVLHSSPAIKVHPQSSALEPWAMVPDPTPPAARVTARSREGPCKAVSGGAPPCTAVRIKIDSHARHHSCALGSGCGTWVMDVPRLPGQQGRQARLRGVQGLAEECNTARAGSRTDKATTVDAH